MNAIKNTGTFAALAGLLAATAILVAPTVGGAQGAAPNRVKIASNMVTANGCHDTTQTFTTQVPNIDQLDRSFPGVLSGIEVKEFTGNNGHAYRNFRWVNNGTAISYELYAKGAGHWVDGVNVFGVKIGGGACVGAAGGSEGIDIFAVYKP
jgi:hypothetical protein